MSGPPDLRGLAPSSRPTPPGPLARGGHVVSKPKPPKKPRKGLRKKNPERSARVHDQAFGPQSRLCRLMPCCVKGRGKTPPGGELHNGFALLLLASIVNPKNKDAS